MTGYTVHTGTSKKFTAGWDLIFEKAEENSGDKSASASDKPKKKKKKAKAQAKGKKKS
jgi:hypothetical protein